MNRYVLVASTILLSSVAALSRKMVANHGVNPFRFELVAALLHAAMSYCMIETTRARPVVWSPASLTWAFIQAFCGFGAAVSFSCAIRGGNDLGSMSSYTSTTPLFTLLLSWLLLGELVSARAVAGMLLIVLGAALIATR